MKKADRQKKIERYAKYDPQAKYKDKSYYDALASDKNEKFDEEYVREAINKEVGKQTKRKAAVIPRKKLFYVRRFLDGQDMGVIDVAENILKETMERNPSWVNLGEVGVEKTQPFIGIAEEKNTCTICGIDCESGESLVLHKQQHV
jgi:hypothetical protein